MSAEKNIMQASRFYVITGGTMVHVAPHFSLCAPAYGQVGAKITEELVDAFYEQRRQTRNPPHVKVMLIRTKMAQGVRLWGPGDTSYDPTGDEDAIFEAAGINFLETNEDLERLIDYLVLQPDTKGIVLATAVCDWEPSDLWAVGNEGFPHDKQLEFGKRRPRLQTRLGDVLLRLHPADKIIGKIRKTRKDIFLVGFKATTGMTEQEQYINGLGLLKSSSCNLVFANDVHEHLNMIITPEEAKYYVTKDRKMAIKGLCEMIALRSQLHFTRSTVIEGDPIPWSSPEIPENLRKVVNHLIARGAYKPFRGKTVGHFAARGPKPDIIYTSRRNSNFNELAKDGLLRIDTVGEDQVIAHGAKPSVGGQSQRIIFDQHPDVDCIVHAHVPLRPDVTARPRPPVRSQRPFECGSHECGSNASSGLRDMIPPSRHNVLKAVMLDEHGPNICFSRDMDPKEVIDFIETFWDLEAKTGGPVELL